MTAPLIDVRDLTMAYGEIVIQQNLRFEVHAGDIFVIMGGSGCGKSTLLRHLIGLLRPARGSITYGGYDLWRMTRPQRQECMRRWGVLFQSGALWSSMTLAENVAVPLQEYTNLNRKQIAEVVDLKLSLVGLAGFQDYYPAELSGGMQKRAGLARAMALDPEILFCDEPSSGLDPLSARRLDELLCELNASLGTTMVVVSHDLDSIFAIASNGIFLDAESRTMLASGPPGEMLQNSDNPRIREFLTRGGERNLPC
ncbi:phospholipid/cholesterol/gamma-HCH transport system ATP-binding protein [Geothermobacter ehrlichii]|uniref:Phospholipid/cholesterol/gamma-HCH transport system ATP-binding protein n=1 Tax=Geothermobacter ehrlichii TaxID=213224 RepID=A0A5D3WJJ8_9BACT|nr:ATP-binding cassette domain-containing protein [Geothermobacter ehrlichii]TYO95854.1 phospholipid/cholesterol/gamma-HCH transport system ATP-binding protein [Geothermobacter ehrlichii]